MSDYSYLAGISSAARCSRETDTAGCYMLLTLSGDETAMGRFRAGQVFFGSPLITDDGVTLQTICAPQDVLRRMWEANNERLKAL